MLIQISSRKKRKEKYFYFSFCLFLILMLIYMSGINTREKFTQYWFWWQRVHNKESAYCSLSMPSYIQNAFMPQFDCNVCEQLEYVPKISNITPHEFSERYAYSGVPIVVTDAMVNWTATNVFSFNFFKNLYLNESPEFIDNNDCQFFPYKTEFKNLREVFEMSEDRAELVKGSTPWYVGWSNCDPFVSNILRKYYQRPYFLPLESEGTKMDWIFMGSPKYGAQMHIDHVGNPSWQSQVKGYKLWILEPPSECYLRCQTLKVTVEPGEIIVLNTNQWYHQTYIVGDGISITIGSEFD